MSSQTPYTKFGFDTEFFELVQGQKGGAVPAGGTQSKTQIEDARRQGYDEGYAVGLLEGQKQAQADLAQLQQHVQNTIMALQQAQTEREEHLLAQMLSLLRLTLHHVVGHAAQHYGAEVFEHHLRSLLPVLVADEALTLRIHPTARGFHEKLALPQASIMGLPMHVKSDPSLGAVDAVVEWANGGVEAKISRYLKAIDDLFLGAGATALPVEPRADLNPLPAKPVAAENEVLAPALAEAENAAPPGGADKRSAGADDIETAAEKAARERARQLLGDDDDDLVDALK